MDFNTGVYSESEMYFPMRWLIDSNIKNASKEMGNALHECIKEFDGNYQDIVIVCIGTDRATGDSLGPLTGHKLSPRFRRKKRKNVTLYGTLESPVHANNMDSIMKFIYSMHSDPLIIAVDACLGKTNHIGFLQFGIGCVCPGAGLNKVLPPIGDIFVTGIVNYSGSMELLVLQNTRLYIVMKMADIIADGICVALDKLNEQ